MKIAYFDCFSGVSGDMILGALIDAGFDLREIESELGKLKICGYKIKTERTDRKGISGTKFSVDVIERNVQRRLKDIIKIVEESNIDDGIKRLSKKIFEELAIIEAKIHNKNVGEMHFHEVGGLDSIIDVIGSVIGIKKLGIENCLKEYLKSSRPYLGICLGLQLLFSEGYEYGVAKGLDIIEGTVKMFSKEVKIPHMGWNQVRVTSGAEMFEGIENDSYYYFDHSYYAVPARTEYISGTTEYGISFTSAIQVGNMWGVQFHPEKSSTIGMKLLSNFVKNAC